VTVDKPIIFVDFCRDLDIDADAEMADADIVGFSIFFCDEPVAGLRDPRCPLIDEVLCFGTGPRLKWFVGTLPRYAAR
jgi:hypothetical protein